MKNKRRTTASPILFILAGFFLGSALCSVAFAESDPVRVLATAGVVEIQHASGGQWALLTASAQPSVGDRIRTGEKSGVDFGFDPALDGMARLGDQALAIIESSQPVRWRLEKGKMWVLWEYDRDSRAAFETRLNHQIVRIKGGAFLSIGTDRTEIRSFGGVWLPGRSDEELPEGFRMFVSSESAQSQERLGYADYQDWKAWMTDAYRLKDSKNQAGRA